MKRCIFVLLLMATAPVLGCPRLDRFDIPVITSSKISDDDQILAVLEDVQRGVESRRIYRVLAHVSRNYHDQEGRDYAGIQTFLNELFKDYRDIRITRTRPRVTVQGDRAKAIETFGTQAKPTNPVSGRPIDMQGQVTVTLEKSGSAWQIVEWGPIQ